MTGLLVSVRSAAEAQVALVGGADIIDVKEPSRGPLGYADPDVWQAVLRAVGGRATTSVVLGELLCDPVERLAPQAAGFAFAKIGLAGCGDCDDWRKLWDRALRGLAPGVKAVPVAYADWRQAQSPPPLDVFKLAADTSRLVVLDTFDKSAGSLLNVFDWDELEAILEAARPSLVTLAGSLDAASIEKLLTVAPAYIGVRTAACRAGRETSIDLDRVRNLASIVHKSRHSAS